MVFRLFGSNPYIRRPKPPVKGKRRVYFGPPGPPYESIARGYRECTVLVVKRIRKVRVRYYDRGELLAEHFYSDHYVARMLAKAYCANGQITPA